MIEFGKSLREAREAKGLTPAQLAEMTKLAPTIITDLEKEDFSRIAAPIYGRGFVKLYCEAVGLDPKPFVMEFMDIINGVHEPVIHERIIPSAKEAPLESGIRPAASPSDPEPMPCTPPRQCFCEPPPRAPQQSDLFISTPLPEPVAPTPPAPTPVRSKEIPPPTREAPISRYAPPIQSRNDVSITSAIPWRLIILCGIALAALVLIAMGIRALYRATSTSADGETPADEIVVEANETEAPAKAAPIEAATPKNATREIQKIPPLYFN